MDDLTPTPPVTYLLVVGVLGVIWSTVQCLFTIVWSISASVYLVMHIPRESSIENRLYFAMYYLCIPIGQVICAALLFFHFSRIESKLIRGFAKETDYYMGELQTSMKCCGVTGMFDWDDWSKSHEGRLPSSCCPDLGFGGKRACFVQFAYETGCMSVFMKAYGNPYFTIAAVTLVLSVIDLVTTAFIYFMDKDTFSMIPFAVNHVG